MTIGSISLVHGYILAYSDVQGNNITFLGSFSSNVNLKILDSGLVTIGTRVLFGPDVSLYAATHSVDVDERQQGLERAYGIEIGDDCWLGGNVTVVAPCKIGKGVTVAAGAVVSVLLTLDGILPSRMVHGPRSAPQANQTGFCRGHHDRC